MKLLGKCITFIKENRIIVFALCIVLLSFVFLALPGQFAHYGFNISSKASTRWNYHLSGYQWIFGTYTTKYTDTTLGGPVAQGIAAFVMLILCVPGLLFSKKSSFVALLTSLALIVISILFFTISVPGRDIYKEIKPEDYSFMSWVPYVIASFVLLAGGLMAYRTVLVMKDEIKHPSQSKGPSYNYLHK